MGSPKKGSKRGAHLKGVGNKVAAAEKTEEVAAGESRSSTGGASQEVDFAVYVGQAGDVVQVGGDVPRQPCEAGGSD